jgi:two-component system, sensor histidine kinase and response regulator
METGTILVVDDDAANQALCLEILEAEGYRVVLASSGEQGIATVERDMPDCILMDIRMPGIDGISACQRIRSMEGGDGVAIIFLTAQRDVAGYDRALAAGGDDFMTKPFRVEELVSRVRTAMRLREITTEHRELAEELRHQRERLQRIELQKEQLIAFLVHDLKNPVNAIAINAKSVWRNAGDAERSRISAARIEGEVSALVRMITNLLDLSKGDEGRFAPAVEQIGADALVNSVVEDLRLTADAVGVRIATHVTTPTLHADPDLLGRLMANLVDNAIRHAPEGSEVRISVTAAGAGVELSIADSGPGIPPALRDAAFDRFKSGGDHVGLTNRGLGLAFCKLVVEAHHGRIWIEDGSPGAVFRVYLPGRN